MVDWVAANDEDTLALSVITLGEIQRGIERSRDSTHRGELDSWLRTALIDRFEGRILAIDAEVMRTWGSLYGRLETAGLRLPVMDSLIAATALVHGLTVVTRNVRDFERCGVDVVNPWAP